MRGAHGTMMLPLYASRPEAQMSVLALALAGSFRENLAFFPELLNGTLAIGDGCITWELRKHNSVIFYRLPVRAPDFK